MTRGAAALVAIAALVVVASAVVAFGIPDQRALGGYVLVDATTRLFLLLVDVIFLGLAVHIATQPPGDAHTIDVSARFVALAVAFLAAANAVVLSNHFVATWIGVELTTLAAAPLIVRPGSLSSRLASWRYFLFSSVGLAMVLLGLSCISRGIELAGGEGALFVDELLARSATPTTMWGSVGLSLVLFGYGTKMGLAPLFSWLPEAYDEAPPPITALLAAVQFNVALVALLRVLQVFRPGSEHLVSVELQAMGLASVALATASLIATTNLRRLVAYASILHGGIIAIGLGVGAGAAYGVLLYAVSNAFIKAILFVTAGKIEARYGTKDTNGIRGVLKGMPYSGVFLMVGTFALLGFPPFGSFLGELLILSGLVRSGHLLTFAGLSCLVIATFVATGRTVFPMIWGQPARPIEPVPQSFLSFLPSMLFIAALVVLGVHLPAPVNALFRDVAVSLGDE